MKKTSCFFLYLTLIVVSLAGQNTPSIEGDTIAVNWQQKIREAIRNKQDSLLPALYFNLAYKKYESFDAAAAMEACNKSIRFGLLNNDNTQLAKAYSLFSRISYDQKTGLEYSFIKNALLYAKKSGDDQVLSDIYTKYGYYVLKEKKYDEGLEIGNNLKKLADEHPENVQLEYNYLQYFSRYYSILNDVKTSISFYYKLIDLIKRKGILAQELGWIYNNMGDAVCKSGDFKRGYVFFDSAIYYNKKFNNMNNLWYAYYNMASVNQELKNYKEANDYFVKYLYLNDSIIKKQSQDKLAELQTQYEVEKKENQIKLLNVDNLLKEKNIEKQQQRMIMMLLVILVSVIMVILAVRAYHTKKKANVLLARQKDEIIEKTEILNKQAAEIAMYKAQMNPHFIFNAINSVQQFIVGKQSSLALEYLNDLSKLIRNTLNFSDKEFISITDELDYLEQYVRFEKLRCDNKFSFEVNVEPVIDKENTAMLPMMIQPFIENAVKHGVIHKEGKGSIILEIKKGMASDTECIVISITDDGVGREVAASKKTSNVVHRSKGMEITLNRLHKLNEKYFRYKTDPMKITDLNENGKASGTKVELLIPFIELY